MQHAASSNSLKHSWARSKWVTTFYFIYCHQLMFSKWLFRPSFEFYLWYFQSPLNYSDMFFAYNFIWVFSEFNLAILIWFCSNSDLLIAIHLLNVCPSIHQLVSISIYPFIHVHVSLLMCFFFFFSVLFPYVGELNGNVSRKLLLVKLN